ncbi:hypothetical protein ACTI_05610 [Actinoplanes sp. OR16]|uniref:hypothetical protein n=1 Tax=Actinoplanes sp. OR16 TaxID=946334 RepID=UPI000F6D2142|nr:hypothetical protein [Actinoplanes sp. OR16]BBH63876.1 hypothetical protein ACTI_05610 [Actinoplanes sp. OR16]
MQAIDEMTHPLRLSGFRNAVLDHPGLVGVPEIMEVHAGDDPGDQVFAEPSDQERRQQDGPDGGWRFRRPEFEFAADLVECPDVRVDVDQRVVELAVVP